MYSHHFDVTAATDDANASGVWKESASGLEWIANDNSYNDDDVSKQVAKMTDDHDSDLDVEVEVVPRSQEEEENFTEGQYTEALFIVVIWWRSLNDIIYQPEN